jgi:hypothetical protein
MHRTILFVMCLGGCAAYEAEPAAEAETPELADDARENEIEVEGAYARDGLRIYHHVVDSVTRGRAGGSEVLCGEIRNTSPYATTLNVSVSFSTSGTVSGGISVAAVAKYLGASLGYSFTRSRTFTSGVSVGPVPGGKRAVVYCYAIGDYRSGTQRLEWPTTTSVSSRRFTSFEPRSLGYRVSYR